MNSTSYEFIKYDFINIYHVSDMTLSYMLHDFCIHLYNSQMLM